MIKTGIFGTSYIVNEARQKMVRLWIELAVRLNPGFPIAIVDSASPFPVPDVHGVEIIQLGDNVGHLAGGGQDGGGRAFCAGLQWAIDRQLNFCAALDTDILFCRQIGPVFDQMRIAGWKAAMPAGDTYPWPENGLCFFDVEWLKQTGFIGRYNWAAMRVGMIPEWHCKDICGRDLTILPYRGRRNDNGEVTVGNLEKLYPSGCDWLTHCVDPEPYHALLNMNGLSDLKGFVP